MVAKVNLKARIERHSRILKDNLSSIPTFSSLYHRFNYHFVFFAVIFLFPIYPSFSSFLYVTSVNDFYRGDIDESSIIDAYEDTDSENIDSQDGFLSVNTLMGEQSDAIGDNTVIDYAVQNGDSFSTIAYKFGVSNNSILWANNFNSSKILHPGDTIKIPPVSGVIYKVVSGDTLSGIAKKYKIDEEKIKTQNGIGDDAMLLAGEVIIVPGAIREEIKPIIKSTPKVLALQKTEKKTTKSSKKTSKSTSKKQSVSTVAKGGGVSEYAEAEGEYELVKRAPKWTFYRGNCTRYVAQYKNVDWSGNAKDWLRNARSKGHATGDDASVGSIIVFNGNGYNPRYGHVGIVTGISGDNIIVSDMNYRRPYEVTTRKVPLSDRSIQGFIYVD